MYIVFQQADSLTKKALHQIALLQCTAGTLWKKKKQKNLNYVRHLWSNGKKVQIKCIAFILLKEKQKDTQKELTNQKVVCHIGAKLLFICTADKQILLLCCYAMQIYKYRGTEAELT